MSQMKVVNVDGHVEKKRMYVRKKREMGNKTLSVTRSIEQEEQQKAYFSKYYREKRRRGGLEKSAAKHELDKDMRKVGELVWASILGKQVQKIVEKYKE